MKIEILPCHVDNYSYLVLCERTGEAVVIDPCEAYPIIRQSTKLNITLTGVLCTHHHADHIGGLEDLLEATGHLPVYCHETDQHRIPQAELFFSDGDEISIGQIHGQVLHTPGHTLGSSCFLFESALFTGDTLFAAGCGRLFEGTAEEMYHSLSRKIATLPDDTACYFGHEYARHNLAFAREVEPENKRIGERSAELHKKPTATGTALGLEKETNPFLRCETEALRRGLAAMGQSLPDTPAQVFGLVRALRNRF